MAQTNYRTGRGILHGSVSSHALYDEHLACPANQTNLTKALASVSPAADKASSWLRRAFDDELATKTEGLDRVQRPRRAELPWRGSLASSKRKRRANSQRWRARTRSH